MPRNSPSGGHPLRPLYDHPVRPLRSGREPLLPRTNRRESYSMKIMVCPSDETGCGKYRLIWPAEVLQSEGYDVFITKRPKILVDQSTSPPKVIDVMIPKDVKIAVFQRPGSYQISQLIPILQEKGIKVIIDMDDDLSEIHPKNPSYDFYNKPYRNAEFMIEACNKADLITTTTEALLEKYASHGRGVLIPNCIPERFLKIERSNNDVVQVGWAGWVATHPEDLQITHGAVNEAIAKQQACYVAIGDKDQFNKLGIKLREPHRWVPGVEFDEYPETVSQLDIGIVPLKDTAFNRAKSWLKALEYASLGVAPVVSPTPDNLKLVEEGAAYVARTPKAWKDVVRNLIIKEEERLDLSTRARSIASNWTIEKNSWRWTEAWCKL